MEIKSYILQSIYVWNDGEYSQRYCNGSVSLLIPFRTGYILLMPILGSSPVTALHQRHHTRLCTNLRTQTHDRGSALRWNLHHTSHCVISEFDGDLFLGQALFFLIAGYETSATTLSYALYELALHPEIQQSLRAEIMRVLNKHNGQLTYDGIQEMAYLDMVVSGEGTETGWTLSCGLLMGAIFRKY